MKEPSEYFKNTFKINTDIKTDESNMILKNDVRLSVLSSRMLRVEIDRKHHFTDMPTQVVINRKFGKVNFESKINGEVVVIITADACFKYDTKKEKMLEICLDDARCVTDFKSGNLKGTYRTLDMTRGSININDGLMSKNGVTFFDDTKSNIINADGTISQREKTVKDEYYLAYNHDYKGCLKDFFLLCGEVPLVPRYCLGNWWSRYKAYSQQEYTDLMKKFIEKKIPITIATIDMDWHWVNVKERFKYTLPTKRSFIPTTTDNIFQGDGWTGYSWNTELFPDYKGLLKWLHENNFKVTLNLHPAQGVRFFEDMYEEMAKAVGIDPTTKMPVKFNITDPTFVDAYFNVIHKPYEKDGVDFWWLDWQQEKTTAIKNLDPLWAVNHYHYLASAGENKRPLILSRYAEIGSHRYPLGFSGDTTINWSCLDFQPYFTSTAANVGYTWWSHDIGGHHFGSKNDELYIRWIQFGLYSPIMRLHSTSNEFMGKEPWKYNYQSDSLAVDFLRERHMLIPYLYAMNYRTHKDGRAICEPLYYEYPEESNAYNFKNEYFFGSELIAAPITNPVSKKTFLACSDVWLPKGRWTDIYTGAIYDGNQTVKMYRGIESIPVLAKEGAIIPMNSDYETNNWKNPENMTVRIFRGNNVFSLYEDDGETNDFKKGKFAITDFKVTERGSDVSFIINHAKGDLSVLNKKRNYDLVFEDISDFSEITLKINGKNKDATFEKKHERIYVLLNGISPKDEVEITFKEYVPRENKDKKENIIDIITKFQMGVNLKKLIFEPYLKNIFGAFPSINPDFKGPIDEILIMK